MQTVRPEDSWDSVVSNELPGDSHAAGPQATF